MLHCVPAAKEGGDAALMADEITAVGSAERPGSRR